MNFIKTEASNLISELRAKLYLKLKAPIDAMWEQLYIASSQHYLMESNNQTYGYCSINDEKSLVQLFLIDEYKSKMENVVVELINSNLITSASISTNEPNLFNWCLALSNSIKVNTYCFEHTNTYNDIESNLNMELVTGESIPQIKMFLKDQVGMNDTFGYTENLVSRKEIYMVKDSNVIIATSEFRRSETQPDITDVGIIVNRNYQGNGFATQLMKIQVNRALKAGRKPICSTTVENIASRKMIKKSGFYCTNIIFDICF